MDIPNMIMKNNQEALSRIPRKQLRIEDTSLLVISAIYGIPDVIVANMTSPVFSSLTRILYYNGHLLIPNDTPFNTEQVPLYRIPFIPSLFAQNYFYIDFANSYTTEMVKLSDECVLEFSVLTGLSLQLTFSVMNSNDKITFSTEGLITSNGINFFFPPLKLNSIFALKVTSDKVCFYVEGKVIKEIPFLVAGFQIKMSSPNNILFMLNDGIYPTIFDYGKFRPFALQNSTPLFENIPLHLLTKIPYQNETDMSALISSGVDFNLMDFRNNNLLMRHADYSLFACCRVGNDSAFRKIFPSVKNSVNLGTAKSLMQTLFITKFTIGKKRILMDIAKEHPFINIVSTLGLIGTVGSIELFQDFYDFLAKDKTKEELGQFVYEVLINTIMAGKKEVFQTICYTAAITKMNEQMKMDIVIHITKYCTVNYLKEFASGIKEKDFSKYEVGVSPWSDKSVIQYALELGCSNKNALEQAALNNFEMFQILIELDHSKINNKINGQSLLHIAVQKGDSRLAKFLIENGINREIQDSNGKTALDLVVPGTAIGNLLLPSPNMCTTSGTLKEDVYVFYTNCQKKYVLIKGQKLLLGDFGDRMGNEASCALPDTKENYWEKCRIMRVQTSEGKMILLVSNNMLYKSNEVKKKIIIWDRINPVVVIDPIDILLEERNWCVCQNELFVICESPLDSETKLLYKSELKSGALFKCVGKSELKTRSDVLMNVSGVLVLVAFCYQVLKDGKMKYIVDPTQPSFDHFYVYSGEEWHEWFISSIEDLPLIEVVEVCVCDESHIVLFGTETIHFILDVFATSILSFRTPDVLNEDKTISCAGNVIVNNKKVYLNSAILTKAQSFALLLAKVYFKTVFIIKCSDTNLFYEVSLIKKFDFFREMIESGVTEVQVTMCGGVVRVVMGMIICGTKLYCDKNAMKFNTQLFFDEIIKNTPVQFKNDTKNLEVLFTENYNDWKQKFSFSQGEGDVDLLVEGEKVRAYKWIITTLFPSFFWVLEDNIHEITVKDELLARLAKSFDDFDKPIWADYIAAYISESIEGMED
ncbi:hypothetical protein EIN_094110 [Entamoeba invadens IP1]|uniref:Uncharacterized protein n=1 Tax=Entamoeba invadens IP1 TaxID=370355 RepID=A0A0A1U021_ENTIV|nr:hypothetical protein EIN_094110 [Entamoeba invadens IP1]ELP87224.1 hypothetical protein EIN_094110 [Entamoeba invadens IP1]|eukprot:XP_004253995.1 hypothetical protein EIN_094110 [Entamoeba invadens IP1]